MEPWQEVPGDKGHWTRVLKDSYWAEVHPNGQYEIRDIHGTVLKRAAWRTVKKAKKAVDEWATHNL